MALVYGVGWMNWHSQMIINTAVTFCIILYLKFSFDESPQWLYSKGKFTELEECLTTIAKRNGVYSRSQIETVVVKL